MMYSGFWIQLWQLVGNTYIWKIWEYSYNGNKPIWAKNFKAFVWQISATLPVQTIPWVLRISHITLNIKLPFFDWCDYICKHINFRFFFAKLRGVCLAVFRFLDMWSAFSWWRSLMNKFSNFLCSRTNLHDSEVCLFLLNCMKPSF